ncbi:MAG: hypothetical protein QHH10_01750 [Peptococcaceae bacterium]|jgi:hypothetical protein|nr:hypothetical protein [Peptococcaceae bacterium]MDH7524020.1 hypothetical protein [Peptococcaceae bacterium]
MLIRIIYEDEKIAEIRNKLKGFNMKQLSILEDIIQREKNSRQKETFEEWLGVLNQYVEVSQEKR